MMPDIAGKGVCAGERMVGASELLKVGNQQVPAGVAQEIIAVEGWGFRFAAALGDQRHAGDAPGAGAGGRARADAPEPALDGEVGCAEGAGRLAEAHIGAGPVELKGGLLGRAGPNAAEQREAREQGLGDIHRGRGVGSGYCDCGVADSE